jgi:toxin ParE1/3/4
VNSPATKKCGRRSTPSSLRADMQIVWTKRAVLNLHHVREFIRVDNPAAVEKVGAKIEAAVLQLARFPQAGRAGKASGTREIMVTGTPYFAVYRLRGDAVEILRVLHRRQKWPSSL